MSEGLNLQDATRLINYDLHWNPVRLMQRIGRVDRRLNPLTEAAIVKAHPETAAIRRSVVFWNFLPADALTPYLKLYERVAGKVLRISKTFGIEGRQLLTGEDDYDDLRNLVSLDGDKSVEESLQLEWEALKADDCDLVKRVEGCRTAFSVGVPCPKVQQKASFLPRSPRPQSRCAGRCRARRLEPGER